MRKIILSRLFVIVFLCFTSLIIRSETSSWKITKCANNKIGKALISPPNEANSYKAAGFFIRI